MSGKHKLIRRVAWRHVLFLFSWTIHFLFKNIYKFIILSVTELQTYLTPPPAGHQLDWGDGCFNWYPAITKKDNIEIYLF